MKWLRLPKIGHDRTVEHYISCALRADAERVKSLAEADVHPLVGGPRRR